MARAPYVVLVDLPEGPRFRALRGVSPEYPDAVQFPTRRQAEREARQLVQMTRRPASVVVDYGLATETAVVTYR